MLDRAPGLEELAELVRSRVCQNCRMRSPGGGCETPDACKLFELFPLVVQAIIATESTRLEDYARAVQENVCSVCVEQALDGGCPLRTQGRCILDCCLAEIVEIVHKARGHKF